MQANISIDLEDGSRGQKYMLFFSLTGYIAYQIKGNEEYDNMQGTFF